MLQHVEWSMGNEIEKELSVCIFGAISFTIKKKALHGFEMSISITQLTMLKISEDLYIHHHCSQKHKSC